jgi:uncharacterized protein (UPF0371 family)
MGVNMVGFCIADEEPLERACKDEILRRYYQTLVDAKIGKVGEDAVNKINILLEQMNIKTSERAVAKNANEMKEKKNANCVSLQLKSGEVITAPANGLTSAASEAVLKALQKLLGVDAKIKLIPDNIMQKTIELKQSVLGERKFHLQVGEVLVILSASAVTSELSGAAIERLKDLEGAEAHATYMISEEEQKVFRKLKINLTQEPVLS